MGGGFASVRRASRLGRRTGGYGPAGVLVVHLVVGIASLVVTGAAGLWGGWCWWRWHPGGSFWRLLRAAQATVVLEAVLGGVLLLMHHKAVSLHYVYGVLPILGLVHR